MHIFRIFFTFFVAYGLLLASSYKTTSDSTKMFDNVDVDGKRVTSKPIVNAEKMLEDDTLPKNKIFGGEKLNVNKGAEDVDIEIKKDVSGRVYLKKKNVDENDPSAYPQFETYQNDPFAQQFQQEYEQYQKLSLEQKNEQQIEIKSKMYQELERRKENFRNQEKYFLRNKNLMQGAQTYHQNSKRNLFNSQGRPKELVELEKNATNLYKNTVGTRDYETQSQYYLKNIQNVGVLTKAFENLNALKDSLESHTDIPYIKCQISRGLVPGYMCPIPGKDQVTFPAYTSEHDLRRINLMEAKSTCDSFCHTDPDEYLCKERKLISDSSKAWSLFSDSQIIWPSKHLIEKEKLLDSRLMVQHIKISLQFTHDDTISDEAFEAFLKQSRGLKIKYSVLGFTGEDFSEDINVPASMNYTIEERTTVVIDSMNIEIYVPVQRPMKKIKVVLYEPYFAEYPIFASRYKAQEDFLMSHGAKLYLKEIEGEYAGTGVYFCMPLQTVPSPTMCNGSSEEINYGDAQYRFLCLDDQHKIGPAMKGGFYSKESCAKQCIFKKECIPTYRHYNVAGMQESSWFKSTITCVDDETNKHCTDDMCVKYFTLEHNAALNHDYSKRPVEEQVVYSDDRIVYTIKDGALTDEIRPKLDLPGEIDSAQIESLKIKEEKDIALATMIKRGTYNRSIYKIGEESPMNLAYIKATNGSNRTYLAGLLKPNSKDFDNGIFYNVYVIYKIEHIFKPKYGEWHIKDHMVSVYDTPLVIKDVTYAIETPNKTLLPFRRDLFREFLLKKEEIDPPESLNEEAYSIKGDKVWTEIPALQRFEYPVSSYTTALPYKKMQFTYEFPFYQFSLLDDVEKEIIEREGILIHDQLPKDYETDIIRKYDGPFNGLYKSNLWNFSVYIIYLPASQSVSYGELLCKIAKTNSRKSGNTCLDIKNPWDTKYGLFDFLNAKKLRSNEVKHDGEINNKIKMFLMGDPSRMSVSMQISPSITERGKRLYKFIFLYDEIDPLVIIDRVTDAPSGTQP